MKKIFVAISMLLMLQSFSQKNYLLKGTIGKRSIVMCITQSDDGIPEAKYFYYKNLNDIFLQGKPSSNSKKHVFTKTEWNYELKRNTLCESFSLSTKNYKNWVGSWTNGKQKLAVTLTKIDTTKMQLKLQGGYYFDEGLDSYYSFIRESKIKLQKDSVTKLNHLTLQWYSEKSSKIKLFRVIAGIGDTAILNEVNKTLHKLQMNEVYAFYDCPNNYRKNGEYEFWVNGVYATSDFLSVDAHNYNDCGGIHPNSGTNYLNFNLHTGNTIDKITDVFNLCDSSIFQELTQDIDDSTNEYTIDISSIDDSVGYCVGKIMQKLHINEMKIDDSLHDNYCRYTDYDRWIFFDFVFRYDGVYFSPNFPHVILCCSYPEWSIIPYSILKKYLKKESQFVL